MPLRVRTDPSKLQRVRTVLQSLVITPADLAGPVLIRLGQIHRDQEKGIFSSEGSEGGSGAWPALSPAYAAEKRRALLLGRRRSKGVKVALGLKPPPISMKILVWTGEMRDRFLRPSKPEYVQEYIQRGSHRGTMRFGASSKIAGYHYEGGPNLPRRDMITKTKEQVTELLRGIVTWYELERLEPVRRQFASRRRAAG